MMKFIRFFDIGRLYLLKVNYYVKAKLWRALPEVIPTRFGLPSTMTLKFSSVFVRKHFVFGWIMVIQFVWFKYNLNTN